MRTRATIDETPRTGPPKVSCNTFEHGIVDGRRSGREFAEGSDVVANIRATRNVGVHELPKKGVV